MRISRPRKYDEFFVMNIDADLSSILKRRQKKYVPPIEREENKQTTIEGIPSTALYPLNTICLKNRPKFRKTEKQRKSGMINKNYIETNEEIELKYESLIKETETETENDENEISYEDEFRDEEEFDKSGYQDDE